MCVFEWRLLSFGMKAQSEFFQEKGEEGWEVRGIDGIDVIEKNLPA